MGETPDQIRRDIEVTRAELRADANRLVDHASPRSIAQRRVRGVRRGLETMKERVMGTSSSVRHQGQEAGHAVAERAEEAAHAVQEMPQRVARQTQGSPLAAGLIAFGAGALVATLIPATRAEQDAVRQLGERAGGAVEPVKEALTESARKLKDDAGTMVGEAADAVKHVAQDAGQTTVDQAKGSAQEVGQHARESGQQVKSEFRDNR